jgi:hypothetical protein
MNIRYYYKLGTVLVKEVESKSAMRSAMKSAMDLSNGSQRQLRGFTLDREAI